MRLRAASRFFSVRSPFTEFRGERSASAQSAVSLGNSRLKMSLASLDLARWMSGGPLSSSDLEALGSRLVG